MKYSKMIYNVPAHVPTAMRMNGEPIARSISPPNRKRRLLEERSRLLSEAAAAAAQPAQQTQSADHKSGTAHIHFIAMRSGPARQKAVCLLGAL